MSKKKLRGRAVVLEASHTVYRFGILRENNRQATEAEESIFIPKHNRVLFSIMYLETA